MSHDNLALSSCQTTRSGIIKKKMVHLSFLKKKEYQTLNLIEISGAAFRKNYAFFQKIHPESKIAPVLKSNAYGHGLELVGRFIDQKIKPPFIVVDSLYEAYRLRKAKVKTPLLLIGYTRPENFQTWRHLNFSFPVFDLRTLKMLYYHQPEAKIHLKIDTGMHRLGILPHQAYTFAQELKKYPRLKIEGIYTHLARANQPQEKAFLKKQKETFKKVIRIFEKEGFHFRWKHLAATAGAMQIFDPEFNLIRLGLGFYGLSPFPLTTTLGKKLHYNLRPALKLTSHIIQIKTISPGQSVSYGTDYIAARKTSIGLLPLGYYEGLDRRLSQHGQVKIGRHYYPLIGSICMNISAVDLSLHHIKVGQKVTVFDNHYDSINSIAAAARAAQTVPYELLVHLSETIKRVLI